MSLLSEKPPYLPSGSPEAHLEPAVPTSETLQAYWRILRKRRWMVIGGILVCVVSATVLLFYLPKIYTASSRVQIKQPLRRVIFYTGTSADTLPNEFALSTQARIITSSLTAQKAAEILQQEEKLLVSVGEILSGITTTTEEPDLITISAKHSDPRKAAAIANAVAKAYAEYSRIDARREYRSAQDYLEKQIKKVRRDLDRIQENIRALQLKRALPYPSATLSTLLEGRVEGLTAEDYITQARRARLEVDALKSEIEQFQLRVQTTPQWRTVKRLRENPDLVALRSELTRVRSELVRLRAEYGEEHPLVKQMVEQEASILNQIKDFNKNKKQYVYVDEKEENPAFRTAYQELMLKQVLYSQAMARAEALQSLAEVEQQKAKSVSEAELQLLRWKRLADVTDRAYTRLLEQLQQQRVNEAMQLGNVKIIDLATIPLRPTYPQPLKVIVFSLVFGLMLGIVGALLEEALDVTVRTPSDISRLLAVPALGFIPEVGEQSSRGRFPLIFNRSGNNSYASLVEPFRMLSASLKFVLRNTTVKTLVVTSCGPKEGKTFTALNLATTLAQAGNKVLLMEGDLRRPGFANHFEVPSSGLAQVLVGASTPDQVIHPTETPNLWVMVAGEVPPNPPALLDSEAFSEMLKELREKFDFVLIDTPPCLSMPDALILGAKADGLLLVVAHLKATKIALHEAQNLMKRASVNLIGFLLNRVRPQKSDYYYEYYRYYYEPYYRGYTRGTNGKRRGASEPSSQKAGEPVEEKEANPSSE